MPRFYEQTTFQVGSIAILLAVLPIILLLGNDGPGSVVVGPEIEVTTTVPEASEQLAPPVPRGGDDADVEVAAAPAPVPQGSAPIQTGAAPTDGGSPARPGGLLVGAGTPGGRAPVPTDLGEVTARITRSVSEGTRSIRSSLPDPVPTTSSPPRAPVAARRVPAPTQGPSTAAPRPSSPSPTVTARETAPVTTSPVTTAPSATAATPTMVARRATAAAPSAPVTAPTTTAAAPPTTVARTTTTAAPPTTVARTTTTAAPTPTVAPTITLPTRTTVPVDVDRKSVKPCRGNGVNRCRG